MHLWPLARSGTIETLRDVRLDPYHFHGRFVGGVESGAVCDKAHMRRGRVTFDEGLALPRPTEEVQPKLAGRYLYAGPLWNHFGHIMVDSIHRLWGYKPDRHDGILFVAVKGLRGVKTDERLREATVPPVVVELMSLLGVPHDRISLIRQPTPVETLDVPEPGTIPMIGVRRFYRAHLRAYQTSLENAVGALERSWPKRIYYGRAHLERRGTLLGASYFGQRLREAGFSEIIPERMTLAEQMGTVLNADVAVFEEGSAAHIVEPLARLRGRTFLLQRRPDTRLYAASLAARSQYEPVARSSEIAVLPDASGAMRGPGTLGVYTKPEAIFARMKSHGLVAGSFDAGRYAEAERADLARAILQADTASARQESLTAIQAARSG